MTFRPAYAAYALGLFVIEVLIALFVRDDFVRPYVGDALVVVLVYCALRAVFRLSVISALMVTAAIATGVEFLQLWRVSDIGVLRDNALARIVFGTHFDPADLMAYACGLTGVAIIESIARRTST